VEDVTNNNNNNTQCQNVAFMTTEIQSYVPSRLELTTWLPSPNDHVVNPSSHISCNHINNYDSRWLQS
jgi:hypothetical protein